MGRRSDSTSASAMSRKEIGKRISTGRNNGYSGNEPITIDQDPHFGWDIGTFFLNGYTREQTESGVSVFLKTLGDRVMLWFNL